MNDAQSRFSELVAKVDAFFERARQGSEGSITCHAGCDDCCRRRFSVTLLEASFIQDLVASLPASIRKTLSERATGGDPSICPALESDGRCAIYDARPLICRTHGLAIRFPAPHGSRSLPVLDACPKNFQGKDLESLDPSLILDQGTLSTILGALDAAYADTAGVARGARVPLTSILVAASG